MFGLAHHYRGREDCVWGRVDIGRLQGLCVGGPPGALIVALPPLEQNKWGRLSLARGSPTNLLNDTSAESSRTAPFGSKRRRSPAPFSAYRPWAYDRYITVRGGATQCSASQMRCSTDPTRTHRDAFLPTPFPSIL